MMATFGKNKPDALGSSRLHRRIRLLVSAVQSLDPSPTPHAARIVASAAAAAGKQCSSRRKTQRRLEKLGSAFGGRVALYARHIDSGETYEILPDINMPTASLIKVPILGAVLHRVSQGSLEYNQPVQFSEAQCLGQSNELWGGQTPEEWDPYETGDDIFARFRDGGKIHLSKLIALMLSFSDNYASLCLQDLAGGGTEINRWLSNTAGCQATRVNARTRGREVDRERWGWGQTTAREMTELTVGLTDLGYQSDVVAGRSKQLLSVEARHEARRLLSRTFWAREGLSVLPPTVAVASKQGAVDRSRSEVAVVCADPHAATNGATGEYAYCVITAEQEDQRWTNDNEGNVLLRHMAAVLWARWGGGLSSNATGGLPTPTGRFSLE